MRKMAAFLVSAIIIISLSACQKPPSQMDYDDLNNKIRQVYPSDNYISIDTKEETASVLASIPKHLDKTLQNGAFILSISADVITFDVREVYNISIETVSPNPEAALNVCFSENDMAKVVLVDGQYRIPPVDTSGNVLMDAGLQWRDDRFFDFNDYRIDSKKAVPLVETLVGKHITVPEAIEKGHELLSALGLEGAYFSEASSFCVQNEPQTVYHYLRFVPIYEGLPIIFDRFMTDSRPMGSITLGDEGLLSVNGRFMFEQSEKKPIQRVLSFDSILENIRQQLDKQNPLAPVPVTRIALCYYPQGYNAESNAAPSVSNAQNSIAAQSTIGYDLQPVWCFYADTQDAAYTDALKDAGYRVGVICVDAVTGNVIEWP